MKEKICQELNIRMIRYFFLSSKYTKRFAYLPKKMTFGVSEGKRIWWKPYYVYHHAEGAWADELSAEARSVGYTYFSRMTWISYVIISE